MTKREQQKERTRRALVDAASRLAGEGRVPTMEELADEAMVSRATAYRYFASAEDAMWQALTDRSLTPVDETFATTGPDPRARIAAAEEVVNGYLFKDPVGTRSFERSTLQRWLESGPQAALRPLRRLSYIDEALRPLAGEMPGDVRARLRASLALVLGTQAVIVLYDICGLEEEQARDVTGWAADALVRAALEDAEAAAVAVTQRR